LNFENSGTGRHTSAAPSLHGNWWDGLQVMGTDQRTTTVLSSPISSTQHLRM